MGKAERNEDTSYRIKEDNMFTPKEWLALKWFWVAVENEVAHLIEWSKQ